MSSGRTSAQFADQADGHCAAASSRVLAPCQRLVHRRRGAIEIPRLQTPFHTRRIDLDGEANSFVHGGRQRLGATHPAQSTRENDAALERSTEVASAHRTQRFVRSLQDSLRPDVDP